MWLIGSASPACHGLGIVAIYRAHRDPALAYHGPSGKVLFLRKDLLDQCYSDISSDTDILPHHNNYCRGGDKNYNIVYKSVPSDPLLSLGWQETQ